MISRCLVCLHEQRYNPYEDYKCSVCGQMYMYDEGHQISLTPEQVELLRKNYELRR